MPLSKTPVNETNLGVLTRSQARRMSQTSNEEDMTTAPPGTPKSTRSRTSLPATTTPRRITRSSSVEVDEMAVSKNLQLSPVFKRKTRATSVEASKDSIAAKNTARSSHVRATSLSNISIKSKIQSPKKPDISKDQIPNSPEIPKISEESPKQLIPNNEEPSERELSPIKEEHLETSSVGINCSELKSVASEESSKLNLNNSCDTLDASNSVISEKSTIEVNETVKNQSPVTQVEEISKIDKTETLPSKEIDKDIVLNLEDSRVDEEKTSPVGKIPVVKLDQISLQSDNALKSPSKEIEILDTPNQENSIEVDDIEKENTSEMGKRAVVKLDQISPQLEKTDNSRLEEIDESAISSRDDPEKELTSQMGKRAVVKLDQFSPQIDKSDRSLSEEINVTITSITSSQDDLKLTNEKELTSQMGKRAVVKIDQVNSLPDNIDNAVIEKIDASQEDQNDIENSKTAVIKLNKFSPNKIYSPQRTQVESISIKCDKTTTVPSLSSPVAAKSVTNDPEDLKSPGPEPMDETKENISPTKNKNLKEEIKTSSPIKILSVKHIEKNENFSDKSVSKTSAEDLRKNNSATFKDSSLNQENSNEMHSSDSEIQDEMQQINAVDSSVVSPKRKRFSTPELNNSILDNFVDSDATISSDKSSELSGYVENEAMEVSGSDTPSTGSNDIVEKGESLGESSGMSTSDEYEEDSFLVDDDVDSHPLLSGSGDDLSILATSESDDSEVPLTQSKQSKKLFNKKAQEKSRILHMSTTSDDDSSVELVPNNKLKNKSGLVSQKVMKTSKNVQDSSKIVIESSSDEEVLDVEFSSEEDNVIDEVLNRSKLKKNNKSGTSSPVGKKESKHTKTLKRFISRSDESSSDHENELVVDKKRKKIKIKYGSEEVDTLLDEYKQFLKTPCWVLCQKSDDDDSQSTKRVPKSNVNKPVIEKKKRIKPSGDEENESDEDEPPKIGKSQKKNKSKNTKKLEKENSFTNELVVEEAEEIPIQSSKKKKRNKKNKQTKIEQTSQSKNIEKSDSDSEEKPHLSNPIVFKPPLVVDSKNSQDAKKLAKKMRKKASKERKKLAKESLEPKSNKRQFSQMDSDEEDEEDNAEPKKLKKNTQPEISNKKNKKKSKSQFTTTLTPLPMSILNVLTKKPHTSTPVAASPSNSSRMPKKSPKPSKKSKNKKFLTSNGEFRVECLTISPSPSAKGATPFFSARDELLYGDRIQRQSSKSLLLRRQKRKFIQK